jgi:Icc protein
MTTQDPLADSTRAMGRREALKCLATWSGAAVVWTVLGGVPRAVGATKDGMAHDGMMKANAASTLTFVQISDTHIGFRKQANPDVVGSLRQAIAGINALPQTPAFVVHTGDVTHLSKPEEFGEARDLLQEIRVDRVHTVPGEHDTIDDGVSGYLRFFDHDRNGRSWYSFDQAGVHFVGLNNVQNFKARTLAELGDEQLAWLKDDLARVSRSTPIVVLAHIPLWTIWEPWGWGTADSAQALALLRPFGSVTVLNGHIHQVLQKVEGNVALHTAMSLAYPLPTPGQAGIGEPGPVTVASNELGKLLGTRRVSVVRGRHELALVDTPLVG